MKIHKLLLLVLFFTTVFTFAQQVTLQQWDKTYNLGNQNNSNYGMQVAPNGDVYYCNAIPGTGFEIKPYILKYNSAGVFQFAKEFTYPQPPRGIKPFAGISRDGQGNIYMAGTLDSSFYYKGFLAKLDANADTVWVRTIGGNGDTNQNVTWLAVKTDNAGNIYLAGARTVNTPSFRASFYTAKYNSNGQLLWIHDHAFPTGYTLELFKAYIEFDNSGNIVVAATHKKDPSGVDYDHDMIALKLTPSGTKLWQGSYNTPGNRTDVVFGLAVDNTGNAYLCGYSEIFVTPNYNYEFAVVKFDGLNGSLAWVYKTSGTFTSLTQSNVAYSIMVNRNANEVYASGCVYNSATGTDAMLVRLNPSNGTEIWRKEQTAPSGGTDERFTTGVLDPDGNIYVTGNFYEGGTSFYMYLAKYNSVGDKIAERKQSGTQSANIYMAIGPYNSIYLSTSATPAPVSHKAWKFIQVTPQTQTFCRSVNKPIISSQYMYDTVNVTGIPPQAIITRVEVKIDTILHAYSPDMIATLRSPQGLVDTLFKNPGIAIGGEDMINCVITDTASNALTFNTAPPFTGYYRPYSPLNAYEGYEPNGNWLLSIYDNVNGADGTLKKYCLVIHYYDLATIGIQQISNETPKEYLLGQNYPNPFNPTTNIKFSIPKSGNVTLKVYDILGKQVAELVNEYKSTGSYVVDFNAINLSSGVYFYRLETEGLIETKKMLMVK